MTVTDSSGATQTFSLPNVGWDWFVTPTDAHAFLRIVRGNGAGTHDPEIEFRLDGKQSTYTITAQTAKQKPEFAKMTFNLWLPLTKCLSRRGGRLRHSQLHQDGR